MIDKTKPTFKEAKEATYSLFTKRCRRLLTDFLREKNNAVCSKCSESCTQGEKIQRVLGNLIENLTVEAATRCDNKVDFFVCVLQPHLTSADLVKSAAKGKTMKSLVKEMEKSEERLLKIVKGAQSEGQT